MLEKAEVKPYYQDSAVTIFHGDCREVIPQLQPADLIFTSPPYLNQRTYGSGKIDWLLTVPPALACAGAAQTVVNLGMVHRDGEVLTYWDGLISQMKAAGHRLFGWYVWDQGDGLPGDWAGRFAPSHEFLFHFNKAACAIQKTVDCRHAGERRAGRTALRGPDGKIDLWSGGELIGQKKIPDSVVRIYRETRRGVDHPAVFPVVLASFIISAFPDGQTLDPFCGSGTTLRAAKDLGRKAIGIEIEERYCEIAARRCAQEVMELG